MKGYRYHIIKKSKGFTLVEVVASIAILAIIVVSMLSMFPQAYNVTFQMGRKTNASNQAQEIIELFYNNPSVFINPGDADGDGFVDEYVYQWKKLTSPTSPESITPTDTDYRFFYIDEAATNNGIDMYKITVIIFYQNLSKNITLYAMTPR